MRNGYFATPLPRVLAHRGFHTEAPENTLLAFQNAIDLGVTHIETDVHATRDGVAVICHDPDLQRIAGLDSTVTSLSIAEMKAIELGDGQTFSTLAEILEAFPDTRFNIDIKAADAAAPAAAAILSAAATDRVLVTAFGDRRRAAAVAELPGVATSASALRFLPAMIFAKAGVRPIVRALLRGMDAVQVPEKALGIHVTTPRVIRMLQSLGLEVHVWTIDDEADMRRLLNLGIDGLITNRSDVALRIVAEVFPSGA